MNELPVLMNIPLAAYDLEQIVWCERTVQQGT